MADGPGRGRRRASRILAILGAVTLLVGVVVFYAGRAVFDSDGFAQRATAALDDERVRAPLAEAVVDSLIENAEPDLVNARPVLISVTSNVLGSTAFESVFREAAERGHRALFTREGENFVLNLADGATLAIEGLQAVSPKLAAEIPPGTKARLNQIVQSQLALQLAKSGEDVRFLGIALPVVALLLLAGAVAADPRRRRGLLTACVSVAVAAGIGFALLLVARSIVLSRLDADLEDAGGAVWDAYLGDLATWLLVLLGGALILAAAINTRRQMDPAEPLRRLAGLASRPRGTGLQVLRALAILAVGVLIVWVPDAFVHFAAVAVGAYAIFYALSELIVLIAPPHPDDVDERPLRERVRLGRLAAGIAILAVAVAVVVAIARDGDDVTPHARAPDSIERCNGFAELCDRRLNEVVLPGVHNAMSAAEDGFLIANNSKGIPDQLEAGVRALLIDAHWGREAEGRSTVVTDLEAEGGEGKARKAAIEATSESFVETAERLIQRQALGEVGGGELGVYFCHVFCELGATPVVEELARITEFLDTHPDEVVLIVIEDYVPPEEIAAAAEESGLLEYAYTPRRDEPLPTLRDMIASGKRVLISAENKAGGTKYPWYVPAFEYAQETPYTFTSVAELEAPASCDRNRGSAQNPLFQLNHWIEVMPRSPKTAALVNSYDFLHGRAKRCDRKRDLLANWLAVDFWEQGDLFEVAQKLNGLGRDAEPEYAETG